ncbi:MAG: YveK family protein, partial [Candidatus Onthomonas sp.]
MADYHTDPVQAPLGQLDLPSLFRDLIRHWWMILSAGLVGMMGAYLALHLLFVPVYTSSATLIVSARGGSGAASDLSATNTMTETFSQVLDSNILKKKVQEQLGLDHFPGQITAKVIPDTNLLTVHVSARHPREAYEVLRGVLDNYDQVTSYMMKNVVLQELDPPAVPIAPSNAPNQRSVLKSAFLAGVVLMTLALAALSYFRDTVKNQGDVAAKLDTRLYLTVYHEQKY